MPITKLVLKTKRCKQEAAALVAVHQTAELQQAFFGMQHLFLRMRMWEFRVLGLGFKLKCCFIGLRSGVASSPDQITGLGT